MLSRLFLLGLLLFGASEQMVDAAQTSSARPFRLCVVDQNTLLLQSEVARNMAARFQQVRKQAQQSFENDSRTLEADARALASLRANLPAAVAKGRADDIERRRARLRERGEQINRDLVDLDAELTKNVMKIADPMIRAAQNERGCSALLARSTLLYLNDTSLDITAAVLQKMNASKVAPTSGR